MRTSFKPGWKFALLGVPALAVVTAVAQESSRKFYQSGSYWVEEITGSLAATKRLLVQTSTGAVVIHGGKGKNITYTVRQQVRAFSKKQARRMLDALHFNAETHAGSASLAAMGSASARTGTADVSVTAPRQTEFVHANSRGGDIEVTGVSGRVQAETAGGHLQLDDIDGTVVGITGAQSVTVGRIGGDIFLRTGGGDISIDSAGHNVNASSGGGDVKVLASRGDVDVETDGGNIVVKQSYGNLHASTSGGSIDVGDIGGAVMLETGGGSIQLASGNGLVDAETVSGMIQCYHVSHGLVAETGAGGITAEFVGGRGEFADSRLQGSRGDVVVYLPPDAGVNLHAAINMENGNNIVSEFPGVQITSSRHAYGSGKISAEGILNGGGPALNIETTTGNIEVRKRKPR